MPNIPKITLATESNWSWRYLTTTRRKLLYSAGLLVLAVGVGLGIALPQAQSALQIAQELQSENQFANKLQQKATELEQVSQSPAFSKANLVNAVLPSKKPLIELLTSLNAVVQDSGVIITNIELSPGKIATEAADAPKKASTSKVKKGAAIVSRDYDVLDVQLTTEGSLEQLNVFLEGVEKIIPASTVTSLSLSKPLRPSKVVTQSVYEAELVISSFYFTKSITSALEAPLPPVGADGEKALEEVDTFSFVSVTQPTVIQGGGLEDLFRTGE